MSKTKRFDIESGEPSGTTFDNCPAKFAGDKQSKRSARFGVGDGDPTGTTFVKNSSHIDFPKANGPAMDKKTISVTSGQGQYSPNKASASNGSNGGTGGSISVGKSSPKSGSKMKTSGYGFKK